MPCEGWIFIAICKNQKHLKVTLRYKHGGNKISDQIPLHEEKFQDKVTALRPPPANLTARTKQSTRCAAHHTLLEVHALPCGHYMGFDIWGMKAWNSWRWKHLLKVRWHVKSIRSILLFWENMESASHVHPYMRCKFMFLFMAFTTSDAGSSLKKWLSRNYLTIRSTLYRPSHFG